MTAKQTEIVDTIKSWSFPLLVTVLSYFGVQTMNKLDLAVDELKQLNNTVRKLEIIQDVQGKEIEKHTNRIDRLEVDNLRIGK